jgi:hypothetical protein
MCTVCHCLIPVSGLTHMTDDGAFHPVIPQDEHRPPIQLSAVPTETTLRAARKAFGTDQ